MGKDIKITMICNNCNRQVKTTMSNLKPCKCGVIDYEIVDEFDIMLEKYERERKHGLSASIR